MFHYKKEKSMNIENRQLQAMTEKFLSYPIEKQVKVLNITENIRNRQKHLPIEKLVIDTWNGLTNSQRRNILKAN